MGCRQLASGGRSGIGERTEQTGNATMLAGVLKWQLPEAGREPPKALPRLGC